jgi:hypothetical protein
MTTNYPRQPDQESPGRSILVGGTQSCCSSSCCGGTKKEVEK